MKTRQQVTLRNGLVAWIERCPEGPCPWIGAIVHTGGRTDEGHGWYHEGNYNETRAPHAWDIVGGLPAAKAALCGQGGGK